jgi:hypothetical protein
VYGYWSALASTPSRRAASRRATSTSAIPHIDRAPALRCETWRRTGPPVRPPPGRSRPPRRSRRAPRPPRCACAWRTGRPAGRRRRARRPRRAGRASRGVDEAARHADRAGIERLVDIRDHRRQLGLARRGCPGRGRRCGPCRARRGTRRSARAAALDGVEEPGERRPRRVEPSAARSAASISRAGGFSGANVYPQLPESWVV